MNKEFKYFIENNFDFLVKLYNRYVRYCLRSSSPLEYYASPYMNLVGYPSDKFIVFCAKYYNKKYNKNIIINVTKNRIASSIYLYLKLIFLFLVSPLFFTKKIKDNSIIIHGFHTDDNFKFSPYRTIKSPPLEYFKNKSIYHDVNISFVSLKSLLKYKRNNITCSIIHLSLIAFIKLHYKALTVFFQSKKINIFPVSYVDILYTLVKGISTSELINNLDEQSKYLHMWENRGYQLISDLLILNSNKSIYLNLGIIFRLAPEYMMFRYVKHTIRTKFLFMSEFNYDLVKGHLGKINYNFFKNYRIDCNHYNSDYKKNNILLIAPLCVDVSNVLYKLILNNKNEKLNIKIRLHPYINKSNFNNKYIEQRSIYESLDDYGIIIYAGITTATIELYFQGKKVYKFVSDEFIDIDPLVDNNLVNKIQSLAEINNDRIEYNDKDKNYYLGCNNKNLNEILKELDK